MHIQLMGNNEGFEVLNTANEQVGKIVWKLGDGVMVMNGTLVDPSLRGQNVGEKLLNEASNYARTNGYKMLAVCPYVVKKFEEFSDYDDVKV